MTDAQGVAGIMREDASKPIKDSRLSAIIEFAGAEVGDPASADDSLEPSQRRSREMFRRTLAVDDAAKPRSRSHALSQVLIVIAY